MKDRNYWLQAFKDTQVKSDHDLKQQEIEKEWKEYFREQKRMSIECGLMTQEEADKLFSTGLYPI